MERTIYRIVFGLLLFTGILLQGCDSDVHCKDDNGNNVDWYVLYKQPRFSDSGLSYVYLDPHTNDWRESSQRIDATGALANTLEPLLDSYSNPSPGFGYVLYNDQPPNQPPVAASYGHSKGLVMLHGQTGVWLSHSVPQFPTYRNRNFWPISGNVYGQTLMCVTYRNNQFSEIGRQLMHIHVYSYDSKLDNLPPELLDVAHRTGYPTRPPWHRQAVLTSLNRVAFTSYAKYTRFRDDLYSGLLVNMVNQDMYVKSWGRMQDPLPSNCTVLHDVYNVAEVLPPFSTESFPISVDHSKWCVTTDYTWACVADMNRATSQMNRGGGAICMSDRAFGFAFYRLVACYEPCQPCYANN